MPPRYAFWTILIDKKPTAFRARDKEELLPTFAQLRRTNSDVVIKWFARGQLWDTPEQAQWAGKHLPGAQERRPREWRPGGAHKDPRARFDKRKEGTKAGHGGAKPWGAKPFGARPQGAKPWAGGKTRFDKRRPPSGRPAFEQRGPKGQPPWRDKKHATGGSFEARKPERPGFKKFRPRPDRSVDVPPGRRDEEPPKRRDEAPESPPPPEQIVIRPEPPERG